MTQARVPLYISTQPKSIGAVDLIPNLLMTTLAVVAIALPPGKQAFASAPAAIPRVECQQHQRPLTLGIPAPPATPKAMQLFDSAPAIKFSVTIDPALRSLALGINPNPQIKRADQSSPEIKSAVQVDRYPNLSTTTLSASLPPLALPLLAARYDWPATPQKIAVQVDSYPNTLVLGYPTLFPAWNDFEPVPAKAQVFAEQQVNRLPLDAVVVSAPFKALDTSQLQVKYQVQADPPQRPLTLGINPNPASRQHDSSAPPLKFAIQVDSYPNLSIATQLVVNPKALMLSDSAPITHYHVVAEQYPVNVVLQLVAIPNVVGETQAQGTTDLQAAGFVVAVQTAFSSIVAAGLIISEVPTGTALPGTTVAITVSLGPQPVSAEVPAGRRQRTIYRITIDGQRFECRSYADALALLERAKKAARQLIADRAAAAIEKQRDTARRVEVAKIEPPKIEVSSRDLRSVAAQTKREIKAIYEDEFRIAEIRMLMELSKRQGDDDESLILLM